MDRAGAAVESRRAAAGADLPSRAAGPGPGAAAASRGPLYACGSRYVQQCTLGVAGERLAVFSGAPSAVWRPCAAVLRLGRGPGPGLQARASHRALRRAGEWCFCLRWSCHLLISVSLCAEPGGGARGGAAGEGSSQGERHLGSLTSPRSALTQSASRSIPCHIRQQQARLHPLCVLGAASSDLHRCQPLRPYQTFLSAIMIFLYTVITDKKKK